MCCCLAFVQDPGCTQKCVLRHVIFDFWGRRPIQRRIGFATCVRHWSVRRSCSVLLPCVGPRSRSHSKVRFEACHFLLLGSQIQSKVATGSQPVSGAGLCGSCSVMLPCLGPTSRPHSKARFEACHFLFLGSATRSKDSTGSKPGSGTTLNRSVCLSDGWEGGSTAGAAPPPSHKIVFLTQLQNKIDIIIQLDNTVKEAQLFLHHLEALAVRLHQ